MKKDVNNERMRVGENIINERILVVNIREEDKERK